MDTKTNLCLKYIYGESRISWSGFGFLCQLAYEPSATQAAGRFLAADFSEEPKRILFGRSARQDESAGRRVC